MLDAMISTESGVAKPARTLVSTSPAMLLTMGSLAIACVSIFLSAFFANPGGAYLIAVGFSCFAIVCSSFWIRNRYDVLEPMTLVAISVFIGTTLRAVYMAFLPQNYPTVYFLIGDMRYSTLAVAELIVPFSLAAFVVGYVIWNKRVPIERFRAFKTEVWPSGRTYLAVIVLTFLGLASTLILIKASGASFTSLATMSEKRTLDFSDLGGTQSSHAGYLRLLIGCLTVGTLMLYAKWSVRTDNQGRFLKFGFIRTVAITVLCLLCMIWPVVSSSRTDVVQIVFSLMIIHVYLRNRGSLKRFLRLGITVLVFALAILVFMGAWRSLGQRGKVDTSSGTQLFFDKTLGSGNFFPAERTGYILTHYQNLDFFYGSTYVAWMASPIPKTIWPDRPTLSLGLYVKDQIYQRRTALNGYPPAMLGEAYINFGYPGLIFMPFLLGMLLKFIYLCFKPLLGVSKNATVVYASILWSLGLQLVGLDFSLFMLNVLVTVIPMLAVFMFMQRPKLLDSNHVGHSAAIQQLSS